MTDTMADQEGTADRPSAEDHEPLPESWARYGTHPPTGAFEARYYAVTVQHADGELIVRHAHPENDGIVRVSYDAVEVEGEVVPRCVYERGARAFNASVTVEWPGLPDEEPATERDRELLWERHREYLLANTAARMDVDR